MRSHVTSSSTYGYNGATQNFLLPFQAYSVRYPNGNQAQAGLLGDLWSNQYFAINVGPVRVIVLMNFIPFGTQCYERFAFTHSVHCHRLMFSLLLTPFAFLFLTRRGIRAVQLPSVRAGCHQPGGHAMACRQCVPNCPLTCILRITLSRACSPASVARAHIPHGALLHSFEALFCLLRFLFFCLCCLPPDGCCSFQYTSHYKEADCFGSVVEPLLYAAGVNIVVNGHVHAYQRTHPVFNYTLDANGPVYITVGDGGNQEGLYTNFVDPSSCPAVSKGDAANPPTCAGTGGTVSYQPASSIVPGLPGLSPSVPGCVNNATTTCYYYCQSVRAWGYASLNIGFSAPPSPHRMSAPFFAGGAVVERVPRPLLRLRVPHLRQRHRRVRFDTCSSAIQPVVLTRLCFLSVPQDFRMVPQPGPERGRRPAGGGRHDDVRALVARGGEPAPRAAPPADAAQPADAAHPAALAAAQPAAPAAQPGGWVSARRECANIADCFAHILSYILRQPGAKVALLAPSGASDIL